MSTGAIQPKISEDDLQKSCITFFQWKYPHLWKQKRLHAIPNGGKRNAIEAAKLKATGVVPGVSDLMLTKPNNRYAGAFFELKVGRNDLSDHQRHFIKVHSAEYYCCVVRSLDEFIAEVQNYLAQTETENHIV